MQIVGMISWWYTAGLVRAAHDVLARIDSLMDYFSIDLLARTFFSPFRQIAAGRVDGPLPVILRAFFDRLFSRVIGAIVRLILLIIGVTAIVLSVVLGAVFLAVWLIVPLLPIAGLIAMLVGWTPWTIL